MIQPKFSARFMIASDIPLAANYWMSSSDEYLKGMGADPAKMPKREDFEKMLASQLDVPMEEKKGLAVIWLADGHPIGHNNVNQINYGVDAKMHLHLWDPINRKKGWGVELLKLSIPLFFQSLELQNIICEPYSLNPAPNKILKKLGFEYVKEYKTIPGSINFEQNVKQYILSKEKFK